MRAAAVALLLDVCATAVVAEPVPTGVEAGLAALRTAALSGNSQAAEAVLAEDLALVSQSGKLYAHADALADLRGGFEAWENRDVVMRPTKGGAIVTLINRRKRRNVDVAEFRVMQVWEKVSGVWRLVAQSSTKIAP